MRFIAIFIFFISAQSFGQDLDSFLTKESDQDPQTYLQNTKKHIPATPIKVAGNFYVIGHCYEHLNQENFALKYYLLAKQHFEKLGLIKPAKELSYKIHTLIASQENYDKYGNRFLNEYYAYAKNVRSNAMLANCWKEFGNDAVDLYDETDDIKALDSAKAFYNKGMLYATKANDDVIKLNLYHNLSAIETKLGNFKLARYYLDKSRFYILKKGNDYDFFSNYFTYGEDYFYEENYTEAIKWLKKAEAIKIPKYKAKTTRVLYKKLMESYDALNDQPNRRKYQKLYLDLEKSINDEEQNIAIHDINVKYEVKEKNRQISALSKFKEKFEHNRVVFSILLFLVFLLALYSFIRWKKIDYHRKKLEAEKQTVQAEKLEIEEKHSKTVEELEKVKKIVIEGYIILKDKTKIYLNDLMYVKAEDHYLHAFSKDGKKHFVRGKLSQLIAELPPNFIKCHRSYIVNTNYIQAAHANYITLKNKEELPVSRSFKWN